MSDAAALCVLASGSAGNCTALRRADGTIILVDAGLSPRMTRQRLRDVGACWSRVTDILLTHADRDHFHVGWPKALVHRPDVTVHVPEPHAPRLTIDGFRPPSQCVLRPSHDGLVRIRCGAFEGVGIALPHDEAGTLGYRLVVDEIRIGFATDLGRVPATLVELFDDLDALLLESNYDPPMQDAAPRPYFLKQRITGGRGHLSNHESLDAVRCIARRNALQHIVLLHLSRQCNCPMLVRSLYEESAPDLASRLVIADQHHPTRWLTIERRHARSNGTPPSGSAARCIDRQVAASVGNLPTGSPSS